MTIELPIYTHQIKLTPIYIAKVLEDVYYFILQTEDLEWCIYQCYAPNSHAEPMVDEPIMMTVSLEDAIDYLQKEFEHNEMVQEYVQNYHETKNRPCTPRQTLATNGVCETWGEVDEFFSRRICYFAMKGLVSKLQFEKVKIKK